MKKYLGCFLFIFIVFSLSLSGVYFFNLNTQGKKLNVQAEYNHKLLDKNSFTQYHAKTDVAVNSVAVSNTFNYVSLGDSIAVGYALPAWENNDKKEYGDEGLTSTPIYDQSYTQLIRDNLISIYGSSNVTAVSYAHSGDKVADLITKLDITDIKNDIEKADLVTICIGANNILGPASQNLEGYLSGTVTIDQLSEAMAEGLNALADDGDGELNTLLNKLKTINPNALYVFTNVYNPYKYFDVKAKDFIEPIFIAEGYGTMLSMIDQSKFSDFETKIDNIRNYTEYYLAGNLFLDIVGLNEILNNKIVEFNNAGYNNFCLVDAKAVFDTFSEKTATTDDVDYSNLVNVELTQNSVITDFSNYSTNFPTGYVSTWVAEIYAGTKTKNEFIADISQKIALTILNESDPHPGYQGHQVLQHVFSNEIGLIKFINDGEACKIGAVAKHGNKLATLPTTTKTGYEFTGWYKETSLENVWDIDSDVVSSNNNTLNSTSLVSTNTIVTCQINNQQLYAGFAKQLTVTSGSQIQHITDINSSTSITITTDASGEIKWFVNNVEQTGENSNSYTFNPKTFGFGKFKIYSTADDVKSSEVNVNIYYQPSSNFPIKVISTGIINTYNVELDLSRNANLQYIDPAKFIWRAMKYIDGSPEDVQIGSNNTLKVENFGVLSTWTSCSIYAQYADPPFVDVSSETINISYQYKVEFDVDGTIYGSAFVDRDGLITSPPTNPEKTEHIFGGWYKEDTCVNPWDFSTDIVTADTILYAKWSQLTYSGTLNQYQTNSGDFNSVTFSIEATGEIKWFVGGVEQAGANTNNFSFTPNEFGEYLIYCTVDGVKSNEITIMCYYQPSSLTILSVSTGYNDFEVKVDIDEANINNYADITKLTWHIKYENGDETEKTNLTILEFNGTNQIYDIWLVYQNGVIEVTSNILRLVPQVMVEFVYNGNTVYTTHVNKNSQVTKPASVGEVSGFVFKGWYTDVEYSTLWDFATKIVTSDTIIYAQYSSTLKIKATEQGGNNYKVNIVDVDMYYIVPSDLTWNIVDENGVATVEINKTELEMLNIDRNYTISLGYKGTINSANVVIKPKYVVKFMEGISILETKDFYRHEKITVKPANPTKSGMIFNGWYTDSSYSTLWDFEEGTVSSDFSLFAKFVGIQHVSGLTEQYVANTEVVTFSIDVVEEVAWFVDEVQVEDVNGATFEFNPTSGIEKTYTIYCKANNGQSASIEVKVEYFVPSTLEVKYEKAKNGTYTFAIDSENAKSIDGSKVIWYKIYRGEKIEIGKGVEIQTRLGGLCEVCVEYNASLSSEPILFEPDYTNVIIGISFVFGVFGIVVAALIIKERKRNRNL